VVRLRGALLLAALLLVAGCTPDDDPRVSSPAPDRTSDVEGGERLRFGILGDVATLDPYSHLASDLTATLVRPVYPSLFRFLPDGSTEPYLAASLEEGGGRAVVELAHMNWSDGTPIVAKDVVGSWRRAGEDFGFGRIDKMRADGEVRVIMRGQVDDWEQALATRAFVLKGGKSGRAFGGPYEIAGRKPGLSVRYRVNPEWTGAAPLTKKVTVLSMDTTDVMLALLKEGKLDAAWFPSTVNLPERLEATNLEHASGLGWSSVRLQAGSDVSPDTMAAIAGALDRSLLHETFIRHLGRVTDTLHPAPGDGGDSGPFLAGGSDGTASFALAVPHGDELLELLQRAIQVQLAEQGFQVDLVTLPVDHIYGPGFGGVSLVRSEGAPGAPDPRSAYGKAIPLFHTESFLVWNEGTAGLDVNPTFEGPLWNLEAWSVPAD
jgi:hypothetical protein